MSHDLNQSVRVFFQQFPWQGLTKIARQNGKLAWTLDLNLPVAQFWGQWPWQGVGDLGGAEVPVAVPTVEEWITYCWGNEP
ncbi:hypothetical protein [Gloeomargarita lithophora]|uniref:hypothetical protein n=1 Tax=Gloeomargarita lithophora TaxID=1188228 RepID=UPI0008F95CB2|nr:hypothetical protein [Gloeomargarita lithophora]